MALAVAILAMAVSAYAIWSNSFANTGNDFNTDTLDPPTSLSVSSVSSTSATLNWTATVDTYASQYRVRRATAAGGPYSPLTPTVPFGTNTFNDTSAVAGTKYFYVVRSEAGSFPWESVNSNEVSAALLPTRRVRTVELFAGQYDGSATNLNQNQQQNFPSQPFSLAETGVSVKDAYVEVQAQIGATTATTYASSFVYFDLCTSPCTPAPAQFLATAGLGTNSAESQTVTLRAAVTSEADLAAYTGAAAGRTLQVGYCFATGASCPGTTAVNIQGANAKLVITYVYDTDSPTQTNTVLYPLESTTAGDQGSKRAEQASCTINSNCPLLNYNVQAPEISSQLSQWFSLQLSSEQTANSITDHAITPQVDGNANGPVHYFEQALARNGGWLNYLVDGLTGYASNAAQALEIGTDIPSTVMGGEAYLTYTYANSAATKTRTVVYPAGEVCTTGCTTKSALTGPTVFFAESGASIKKAWFRVHTSHGASTTNETLSLTTKVGNNAETAQAGYAFGAATQNVSEDGYFIHVIPASDYAELAAATATSGKAAQMTAQWSATAPGGAVSAELVITYTYTGEAGGYEATQSLFAGQQTAAAATSFSTATGAIDPALPETIGTRTIRGASLLATAKDTSSTANGTIGSNLTTTTCTATATSTPNTDALITRIRLWKDLTSVVTTSDAQTYTACYAAGQASIFGGVLVITHQWGVP
jgi:hypothetical protein